MVCPYPFKESQLKESFIRSSPYASCLPCVIPMNPLRAFTIISPTLQMMKLRFKEAKKPEIPQLMWPNRKLSHTLWLQSPGS